MYLLEVESNPVKKEYEDLLWIDWDVYVSYILKIMKKILFDGKPIGINLKNQGKC